MTAQPPDYGVAFHVHHQDLIEVCEGLKERVAVIEETKPKAERPTRLRLLAIIPDRLLPAELRPLVRAARAVWAKRMALTDAYEAERKPPADAYWAEGKALTDAYWAKLKPLEKAIERQRPALEALHAKLCKDCPWDGRTIFPGQKE